MEKKIKSLFIEKDEIPLFAVDIGSRNWRVNNEASDYDIKGVYIRSKTQLFNFKYEAKKINILSEELDFTCYEFNNFLTLISENSPTSFEMLRSDLVYLNEIVDFPQFAEEVSEYFDLDALANAFIGYGRGNLNSMKKANAVTYKTAFLALRPLLYADMLKNGVLPNNSIELLLKQVSEHHPIIEIGQNFIAKKKIGAERDILVENEAERIVNVISDFSNGLKFARTNDKNQERLNKFLEEYSYNMKSAFYK